MAKVLAESYSIAGERADDYCGYLTKSDTSGRKFRNRYFVLRQNTLTYYTSEEVYANNESPNGSFNLRGASTASFPCPQAPCNHAFQLIVRHHKGKQGIRITHLCSDSSEQLVRWHDMISRNIPRQKNHHEGYLKKSEECAVMEEDEDYGMYPNNKKTQYARYFFVLEDASLAYYLSEESYENAEDPCGRMGLLRASVTQFPTLSAPDDSPYTFQIILSVLDSTESMDIVHLCSGENHEILAWKEAVKNRCNECRPIRERRNIAPRKMTLFHQNGSPQRDSQLAILLQAFVLKNNVIKWYTLLNNLGGQQVLQCLLAVSLFGSELFQLLDFSTSHDEIMHGLFGISVACFTFELCLCSLCQSEYYGSFFFWTDLFGSLAILGTFWCGFCSPLNNQTTAPLFSDEELFALPQTSMLLHVSTLEASVLLCVRALRSLKMIKYIWRYSQSQSCFTLTEMFCRSSFTRPSQTSTKDVLNFDSPVVTAILLDENKPSELGSEETLSSLSENPVSMSICQAAFSRATVALFFFPCIAVILHAMMDSIQTYGATNADTIIHQGWGMDIRKLQQSNHFWTEQFEHQLSENTTTILTDISLQAFVISNQLFGYRAISLHLGDRVYYWNRSGEGSLVPDRPTRASSILYACDSPTSRCALDGTRILERMAWIDIFVPILLVFILVWVIPSINYAVIQQLGIPLDRVFGVIHSALNAGNRTMPGRPARGGVVKVRQQTMEKLEKLVQKLGKLSEVTIRDANCTNGLEVLERYDGGVGSWSIGDNSLRWLKQNYTKGAMHRLPSSSISSSVSQSTTAGSISIKKSIEQNDVQENPIVHSSQQLQQIVQPPHKNPNADVDGRNEGKQVSNPPSTGTKLPELLRDSINESVSVATGKEGVIDILEDAEDGDAVMFDIRQTQKLNFFKYDPLLIELKEQIADTLWMLLAMGASKHLRLRLQDRNSESDDESSEQMPFLGEEGTRDHAALLESEKETGPVLRNFVNLILARYNNNLYHNKEHAVMVLHSFYCISNMLNDKSNNIEVQQHVSELTTIAGAVACLAHDIGHPGVNNAFLVTTRDDLAIWYNDVSVLENMHCARLYQLLRDHPEADIFKALNQNEWGQVRATIIGSILATDMTNHFKTVSELQAFQLANEAKLERHSSSQADMHVVDLEGAQNEFDEAGCLPSPFVAMGKSQWLVEVLVHYCDISSPIKGWAAAERWAMRIMEEMFSQGDQERKLGLSVSPMCDRIAVSIPQMQCNFLDFVIGPLHVAILRCFPSQLTDVNKQLVQNRMQWGEVCAAEHRKHTASSTSSSDVTAALEGNQRRLSVFKSNILDAVTPQQQRKSDSI